MANSTIKNERITLLNIKSTVSILVITLVYNQTIKATYEPEKIIL